MTLKTPNPDGKVVELDTPMLERELKNAPWFVVLPPSVFDYFIFDSFFMLLGASFANM